MSTSDEIKSQQGTETVTSVTKDIVTEAGRPFEGPAAAAVLAAGAGALTLGVVTTLAEASTSFADWLAWSDRIGPLSGKTILAVAAWLASWVVLYVTLRGRGGLGRRVLVLTGVLIGLGVLGTFPTFFDLFAD